ncbi:hypothetical protein KQI86_05950 [Clostridium sp. MSJ-11]|uniref:Lipoprotein n=1 Tax=Clostridium mobile TaxID=2841512 RepID=A0ABS6EHC6_9CLOT|nr:hypothetical protein [Clostridium mobile]MBU5483865.1 hypothetical protein [Clostridium mobile]
MKKSKKIIIGIIFAFLVCSLEVYRYININKNIDEKNNFNVESSFNEKSSFNISQVDWTGQAKWWTDNSGDDLYDIKFEFFDGTDIKEIITENANYDMKIKSDVGNGELNIKIYNGEKILFDKSGKIEDTVTISNNGSKNVRIELTAKEAEGHVKIELMPNIIRVSKDIFKI